MAKAVAKPIKSIVERTTFVNLESPKAIADFANELKKFIVEQKLFTPIENGDKTKNYVNVEGWQFAGFSTGLMPVIEKVEDLSPKGETFQYKRKKYRYEGKKRIFDSMESVVAQIYKYRAEVKLIRIKSGEVVGTGVAVCTNMESKKNTFDEYAVASMAQTRAVGKAYRNTIGWIMKLAGYEATPSEEIESEAESETESSAVPNEDFPIEDVRTVVDVALRTMVTTDKLRFLKDATGSISDHDMTDMQYRLLYQVIRERRELAKEAYAEEKH